MIFGAISAGLGINQALGNPLGSLFGGSSPPNVQTSGTQQTQLPSWYTAYMQGALGTGQSLASIPYQQYTGQRLAGFNDTQNTAFNNINNAQGNWTNTLNGALSTANAVPQIAQSAADTANQYGSGASGLANQYSGANAALANQYGSGAANMATGQAGLANQYASLAPQIAGQAASAANQYGQGALAAASAPIQQWTDPGVAQSWMSPYTNQVVNSIAQQGNQNWNTNLMPGIEAQFIGSGNANSAQNAAALGIGAANTQQNISSLQSQALQSGYQNAMTGFQTGQGQQLQQSGLAANTGLGAANAALTGGNLGVTGGLGAASNAINAGNMGVQGYGMGANTALGAGQLGSNTAISGGTLGANTAISGGQLGVTGGLGAASALQSGAQAGQTMTYNDIAQMLAAGTTQQNLAQTGYNTAYQNFLTQQQYPWTQLQNLNQIATGAQLPTSTSATGSAPLAGATYGPSAAAYGYAALSNGTPTLNSWLSGSSPSTPATTSPSSTAASQSSWNTLMGALPSGGATGSATGIKRGGLYRASSESLRRAKGGSVSPLNKMSRR